MTKMKKSTRNYSRKFTHFSTGYSNRKHNYSITKFEKHVFQWRQYHSGQANKLFSFARCSRVAIPKTTTVIPERQYLLSLNRASISLLSLSRLCHFSHSSTHPSIYHSWSKFRKLTCFWTLQNLFGSIGTHWTTLLQIESSNSKFSAHLRTRNI